MADFEPFSFLIWPNPFLWQTFTSSYSGLLPYLNFTKMR